MGQVVLSLINIEFPLVEGVMCLIDNLPPSDYERYKRPEEQKPSQKPPFLSIPTFRGSRTIRGPLFCLELDYHSWFFKSSFLQDCGLYPVIVYFWDSNRDSISLSWPTPHTHTHTAELAKIRKRPLLDRLRAVFSG